MADLKVIIKALFEGSDEIDKAKKGVEDIAGATEEVGTNATNAKQPVTDFGGVLSSALGTAGIIAAGVMAVAKGLETVYEAAKAAAELDLVETQFENITEQSGLMSSSLKTELAGAVQGISSEQQIMLGTTAALSSGLAQNEKDLIAIAEASADLGMPMSDFVEVLNSVSESKLEGIGVTVDDFKGKVDALVEGGQTEKAAQLAVALEGVSQKVEDVGSFTETAAGKFVQFETAQTNMADHLSGQYENLGEKTLPVLTKAMNNLVNTDKFNTLRSSMEKYGYDIRNVTKEHEILGGMFTQVDSQLVGQMEGILNWTNATVSSFHAQGMSLDAAKEKTVNLFNEITALEEVPLDAIELEVSDDEVTAAQGLLDTLNATAFESKESELTVDDQATVVIEDLNSMELEDKESSAVFGVDDTLVEAYVPPVKSGTVLYGAFGIDDFSGNAVGGSVNAGQPYTWQEYGYRGEVFVPSADGFVLSRADAERALARALYGGGSAVDPEAIGKAVAQAMSGVTAKGKGGNVYNLTMPTSNNPADVRMAFELMEAWGA